LHVLDVLKKTGIDNTVSRRLLTAEALVRSQVCGGQSGIRTGFSQRASVVHSQYHSTLDPHSHLASPH
jgi:hypothetical protein